MTPLPALITLLTLVLYLVLTINVSLARLKYGVKPPQMLGDLDFERVLRVQQNTLEQIVVFLPALWLFCQFVDPVWGAALGAIWIFSRIVYAWGYYQAAEKRFIGFGISSLTNLILLIGSLVKIGLMLTQTL